MDIVSKSRIRAPVQALVSMLRLRRIVTRLTRVIVSRIVIKGFVQLFDEIFLLCFHYDRF